MKDERAEFTQHTIHHFGDKPLQVGLVRIKIILIVNFLKIND